MREAEVIVITGGLAPGLAPLAMVDGVTVRPLPGEALAAFQARVAPGDGVRQVIIGGLPDDPP